MAGFAQGVALSEASAISSMLGNFISGISLTGGKGPVDAMQCYAQEVTLWSNAYFGFSATTGSTTLVTQSQATIFDYSAGKSITPSGVAGYTAFAATAGDTNWSYNQGQVGQNELYCMFGLGIDVSLAKVTTGLPLGTIPTAAAVDQIGRSISYTVNEGNTIARNFGLICDYPSGVGTVSAGTVLGATAIGASTVSGLAGYQDVSTQNGGAYAIRQALPLAQLWKPTIQYQHILKVEKASVLVDGASNTALVCQLLTSNLFCVRVAYRGWRITAPV